jgi:hypothetical protein
MRGTVTWIVLAAVLASPGYGMAAPAHGGSPNHLHWWTALMEWTSQLVGWEPSQNTSPDSGSEDGGEDPTSNQGATWDALG